MRDQRPAGYGEARGLYGGAVGRENAMSYVFASVFSSEMNDYLSLLREAGRYINRIQSSLRSLDRYLADNGLSQKKLDAGTVSSWIMTRSVSVRTKIQDIIHVKGFAKYLVSLGFKASCPETPKARSSYVPYIFSDTELERIFSAADNFESGKKVTRSALVFPVLLRLLYGCGLRLGEGRSLRWKDIDFENDVLVIREAKNLKQRFVPMDGSMADLLRIYREMTRSDGICDDYIFESEAWFYDYDLGCYVLSGEWHRCARCGNAEFRPF